MLIFRCVCDLIIAPFKKVYSLNDFYIIIEIKAKRYYRIFLSLSVKYLIDR